MTTPKRGMVMAGTLAVAGILLVTGCGTKTESAPAQSTAASSSAGAVADQSHNQQDVMFAQHMVPHHQQAIEMSDIILPKSDIDPRVTALAEQIKAAQGPEIEQMQGWISQWGAPTMPMTPGMDHGTMPGMDHSSMPGMSGMMSAQDMDALKSAQGAEASKLYLTQMIEHHQGAITMAQTEITSGRFQPAITLAQSIVTSQQKEIDDMKAILATM